MLTRFSLLLALVLSLVVIAVVPAVAFDEGDNVKLNTNDFADTAQNEESMVINPNNPDNVLAVWRDFRLGYRRVGIGTSFDGGFTWTDSLFVGTPYINHSDPVMSYSADSSIYACLLTYNDDLPWSGIFIFESNDGGTSWKEPYTVVDEDPTAFEDKQWINVDRTNSAYHGRIYTCWTRFTSTTDIKFIYGDPAPFGPIFSLPIQVSDQTSVQWPTVTVGSDGTVYCAWGQYALHGIMVDKSTTGGASWGTDVMAQPTVFTDFSIAGGIRAFSFPAMEADISGGPYDNTIYILFTDRAADGLQDLYVTKSTDNAATWTERHRINDDRLGNGVDQFHPWVSINDDGILTAVWFDRRNDPNNLNFDLYMAHSFDGGDNWTANRRISDVSSSPADAKAEFRAYSTPEEFEQEEKEAEKDSEDRSSRAGLIGEYVGLSTRGDKANTCWTDTRNGNQDVYGTRVTIGFSAPPLISPAQNAVTAETKPTFTWGKTGATPAEIANFPGTAVEPLFYVLEVDDDSTFASVNHVDSNLTITTEQITTALGDGTWYWRVSAVNTSGRETGYLTPYWRFDIDLTAPAKPLLFSPAQDDTVANDVQDFFWSSVSDPHGVHYQLRISTDSSFASVDIDESDLNGSIYESTGVLLPNTTYYWQVRSYDDLDNSLGFTDYQRFHTAVAYLCGDASGDGLVNVTDAVALVQWIFADGPAPDPIEAGDANCDGTTNITDAVYIITFIFAGGPAPCETCP